VDELTIRCMYVQPNTTDPDGESRTWHIPITAHVVITLSSAKRLTGVRLNSLLATRSFSHSGVARIRRFEGIAKLVRAFERSEQFLLNCSGGVRILRLPGHSQGIRN